MADSGALETMSTRLDKLYEFDREPVTEDRLHNGGRFAAVFSGEHVAGTEFVIGAFFVLHGVNAFDLLVGLLIGNLLAVLSWTFVCAPIATQVRLTLYWYLRKIAGPGVMVLYNLANAILFCILAGAMISVAATAVGIPFNIAMPKLTDVYPNSVGWVLVVLGVGSVVGVVAVMGFKRVSQFSSICVPWMFLVFIAGAIAVLPQLGEVNSISDFWTIAQTKIWTGTPVEGQEQLGMMHIIFFAWFCNLAMHIGLSDMALFRYAKNWKYGLYSALGMYLGHFLAWICSGIMVAAYGAKIEPGLMAYSACGLAGAIAVVIAGWTTANPTIYRSGLALQIVTPNWPRWVTTVIAFVTATILACFPAFVMNLLDFVAIYGIILMPIGAVVFAEHWIFPMIGLKQYWAEERGVLINWPALITWVAVLLTCWFPMGWIGLHLFFRWLPGYILALGLYIVLCMIWGVGRSAQPAQGGAA
ncbi:hypothetical protein K8I31_07230 [bacterium]|nr:hypothetical protein [bacterium]